MKMNRKRWPNIILLYDRFNFEPVKSFPFINSREFTVVKEKPRNHRLLLWIACEISKWVQDWLRTSKLTTKLINYMDSKDCIILKTVSLYCAIQTSGLLYGGFYSLQELCLPWSQPKAYTFIHLQKKTSCQALLKLEHSYRQL